MKKNRLIQSLLLLIFAFLLTITATYAWISLYESAGSAQINTGQISYTYHGSFIDESEIVFPDKELLNEDIFVNNQSNIDTSLRLKIDYTLVEEVISLKTYKNEISDDLFVEFGSSFVLDGDYWYYIASDHAIANTGVIALINSIYYDGFKASNEYATNQVSLYVLIQVKQADHVEWTDLTSIDFNG
ncbi:MAG: hypothetical protein AB7E09_05815 [Candidatus Izemoplasmatales bacterium]